MIAAVHPGPQHVATDNIGAVKKWTNLLRLIECNELSHFLRKRPWGMRPDGDVWEVAATIVRTKGPSNIKVTWTKGHATEDDVQQGKKHT